MAYFLVASFVHKFLDLEERKGKKERKPYIIYDSSEKKKQKMSTSHKRRGGEENCTIIHFSYIVLAKVPLAVRVSFQDGLLRLRFGDRHQSWLPCRALQSRAAEESEKKRRESVQNHINHH